MYMYMYMYMYIYVYIYIYIYIIHVYACNVTHTHDLNIYINGYTFQVLASTLNASCPPNAVFCSALVNAGCRHSRRASLF